MSDAPQTQQAEIKIVGYCRTCGTGLDEANVRYAHGTVYCAEHVPKEAPPYTQANASGAYSQSPYTAPAHSPYSDASPGTAFVLGLIPGVGAIYNGQYAKGIVHIVILAMLIMAVDNGHGAGAEALFGMLIPGFIAYMAFEAFHTAKRRREGLPVDEFSGLGMMPHDSRIPVIPLLLIAFGIVFLLDNMGLFDLRDILKFWPVMMIGLGVYLLYARLGGNRNEPK